jgi:hypothetical protein
MLKKQLAIGLAAALAGSSALADFQLDLATQTTATFALEDLDTGSSIAVGTATYYTVANASGALDVTGSYGVGVISGAQTFIRYDLTNGVFAAVPTAAISAAGVGGGPVVGSLISGGSAASNAVFQFTAPSPIGATSVVSMSAAAYAGIDTTQGIGIGQKAFETGTAATTNGTAQVTKVNASGANMISYGNAITSTIAGATTGNVASVATGFSTFSNAAPRLAVIGSATITGTTGILARTGAALNSNLSEVANTTTSTFVVTGDSFGSLTQSFGLSDSATCAGTPTALTANAAGTASVATALTTLLPLTTAAKTACMTIAATNGTAEIPKGNHTVAITFTPQAATQVTTVAAASGTIGTIAHDGTTVQLPYLTTFSDYNQRVVMTNRGTAAVTYTVTPFQTEAGVTAAAGTGASGSIPAGGVAVVKTSDIVTLTGGTRAAATLNIIAADANINVATTQVNLSDGSTDTVINN